MTPYLAAGSTPSVVQTTICDNTDFEEFTNPTIVRIRGRVNVHLLKSDADQPQNLEVALGIGLVDVNVITPGDILTKAVYEYPWMWTEYANLWSVIKWEPAVNSSGTVISLQPTTMSVAGITHQSWSVDIKAMRRVPQDKRLVLTYSWQSNATAGESLEVSARLRTLIKE